MRLSGRPAHIAWDECAAAAAVKQKNNVGGHSHNEADNRLLSNYNELIYDYFG